MKTSGYSLRHCKPSYKLQFVQDSVTPALTFGVSILCPLMFVNQNLRTTCINLDQSHQVDVYGSHPV